MQYHQLKILHRSKRQKRIGRGGKRGTYSGKGIKGQLARSGRKLRPELRDIIKKVPKKRGYKFGIISQKPAVVALRDVDSAFENGGVVSPQSLLDKKLVGRLSGRTVKILGKGPVAKKLIIEKKVALSSGARTAIEKAGGTIRA